MHPTIFTVLVPRELFVSMQKSGLTDKDCLSNLWARSKTGSSMANKHSPDKVCLSVWVARTLKARVERAAKGGHMTLSDWLVWRLTKDVEHVELTPEDYERIARETREAVAHRRGGAAPRDGRTTRTARAA